MKQRKWNDIWKLPFTAIYSPYIYSDNNVTVATCFDEETLVNVCNLLNDKGGTAYKEVEIRGKGMLMLGNIPFVVRGWGHLTGVRALNLSDKEASKIQDEFIEWIISKIKE